MVLCAKPNCLHISEKCPAYIPFAPMENEYGITGGLAQIDKYIYFWYQNYDMSDDLQGQGVTFDFVRLDPGTGVRVVLMSLPGYFDPTHEDGDEQFYCSGVPGASYKYGWAWCTAQLRQKGDEDGNYLTYNQEFAYHLETGEIIRFENSDETGKPVNITVSVVTADYVVYYILGEDTERKYLSRIEYKEVCNDDGSMEVDGMYFADYSEYFMYMGNKPERYREYLYNMKTGEISILYDGYTVYDENRTKALDHMIYSEYQGDLLIGTYLANEEGLYDSNADVISLYDIETGESSVLLELVNGYPLAIAQGSAEIFPNGKLFYGENETETSVDLYCYDVNTGESTFMYTDDPAITFRIFGQYNGGYIGKHKDHQDDGSYYWISEEDFFAGNLDAMVRHEWK